MFLTNSLKSGEIGNTVFLEKPITYSNVSFSEWKEREIHVEDGRPLFSLSKPPPKKQKQKNTSLF